MNVNVCNYHIPGPQDSKIVGYYYEYNLLLYHTSEAKSTNRV